MSDEDFDMGGAEASPDRLEALNNALEEAVQLEETVEQMEEDLRAAKKSLNDLKAGRIPDLMDELQMEEVKFQGWQVKIGDFVSGNLPKDPDAKATAIGWLEANEAGGLIKTDLNLSFGKSQHNEALSIAKQLEKEGYAPNVASGVHTQTLHSFARERIKNGEPLDTDILGLYVGKVAKFKRAKE